VFFDTVRGGLDDLKVAYKVNPKIVRGLDYYTHTVFEFVSGGEDIGAQNTVLAGGRYDGLISQMGGPETPSVGFAAGVERLALLSQKTVPKASVVAVLPEENNLGVGLVVSERLRSNRFATELFVEGRFDKRMKKANKAGADVIVIIKSTGIISVKSSSPEAEEKVKRIEALLK